MPARFSKRYNSAMASVATHFANLHVYAARFVGDLMSLLIGGLSAVPLAYGYFRSSPSWLTADGVKWGVLAAGFILVSYRLWLRAEHSRTSDAFAVLATDASDIYDVVKWMVETFEWPPKRTDRASDPPLVSEVIRPLQNCIVDNISLMRCLCDTQTRILRHSRLVVSVAAEHGIVAPALLDPETLNARTMLKTIEDYISDLKEAARPPESWLSSLSRRRCRR